MFLHIFLILILFANNEVSEMDRIYTKAILDTSNEPYFVLVTIINDSLNVESVVAVEAPFLLGAIHVEYNIPYTEEGSKRTQSIALSNKTRVFRFKKQQALKNAGIFYNQEILTYIREKIGNLSKENLIQQLKNFDSELHKLYQGKGKGKFIPYRNAIAHILLEKGIVARRSSKTGNLFTE